MKRVVKKDRQSPLFLPLLSIAALLLITFTISSINKKPNTRVLGDSSESDSSNQQTESNTPQPSEHPDVQTPEPKDTPEPSATPEIEIEKEVKNGTATAKIKIHQGDAFQFEQEGVNVQIQGKTPLSVNPTTKELSVTTPTGVKMLATLPAQAVQNLVGGGIISTQSAVQLTTDANGNPVYEINGVKYERLLGLFTVAIDKTGQVSAQNGQVLAVSQSLLSRLLDAISF